MKQAMDLESPPMSTKSQASPPMSIKSQASSPMGANKQTAEKEVQETTNHCNTPSLLQKVLAEFVATYVLVFAGCGSVVVNESSGGQLGLVGIAATWGIVVMVMVYATSHISGTHINPAVTLAFAFCHRFPWRQVPWYIGAQTLASIGAALTLKLVFYDGSLLEHMVTRPSKNDYLQSFVVELIITSILSFVVSGVTTDTLSIGSMAGIVIGATVAMNVLIAGPVSGASMNPARSLGPAIIAESFKELYVYMLAPSVGAIIGCLVYNSMRLKKQGEKVPQGKPFSDFWILKGFPAIIQKNLR